MPFVGALIGAAGSIIGSKIASNGVTKATNQQLAGQRQGIAAVGQANQQAQGILKDTSQQQQALFQPYTTLGTGALNALGSRMGIAPPGTVAVRNPQNGQVYHLPQDKAQQAIQSGGVAV